jgi:hypothetical protein
MRRILASAAAIALIASTAGTAIAKDHTMPADSADAFGQPRADESYVIGGETAKVAAKAGTQDGSVQSAAAQAVEREPAMPASREPAKPEPKKPTK